ncbi:flippase [Hespellia stercorisuis]|uniref:Membrane protein involved in the export of O-antigen and teichoic acid n=1 Tax=Hespellia stercorisuis DSM 15480 TaxID=1121950 RepID=A0A1M6JXW4_9FIRM|nr:flippase [Hespellia stercorisuis]SHJ51471.1 Membrane protein involved in the export of O-antigen and teichoic acid [Hespellia stercorisuis DSM 15480]
MSKLLEKLKKNPYAAKFLTNTGWLIFDKVFHMALSLVVTGMVSRYLGTEKYGYLSYGLAFIEIFTIVCKLGIDGIIVNELVKQREKNGEILGTTIVLRLISSLLSLALTAVFVWVLNPGKMVILAITMIQSVSLIFVAFDTLDYYFQSVLQSKYVALARSISYPLVCLLRLILVLVKAQVAWFAWATVLDAVTIGIVLVYFYYKSTAKLRLDEAVLTNTEPVDGDDGTQTLAGTKRYKLKFSMSMTRYLMSHSYHFIAVSLLVTIYTQMDKLMVGYLSTQTEVGLYSAGMLVANLWIFIPNAIIDSGRPLIMTLKAEGREEEYQKRMKQLSAGIIWVSILAGVFFSAAGTFVVWIIFGKDFMAAATVLRILIWSRLFSLLGTVRSVWMLCEKQEKDIKYFIGLGAAVNVVLNAVLIPQIGAAGAAVATLVTEVVSSFIATGAYKKTRPLCKMYLEALLLKGVWK